ncbi:FAD-dependent oxidoreductase [Legionella septentrionalis]|uniref:FAD-binding protein n=1 Tax=Legionella septentrionalis TaxID=2498109 RepID=A0A3S0V6J6_9GAMM|nr:FAD-dependent monooxygenase [Legionella septentrionalis]RUQ91099.1 FAD-binding protein [Legionella septentrionalis]RUR02832.1 FAD-binding protein [Legionella septentrionalis]RUR11430.1 FAD-binding protein [Legionella septentrionalis]RUR15095.1 FAD-binding protein [Legionella septentrionalis]
MSESCDVLVVGAGPVGLFCAHELIRNGLSCRIIDKKLTLSERSKALGIHIRTLDIFADCGVIGDILGAGHKVQRVIFKSQGKELGETSFADLDANYPYLIDLPQSKTERILHDHLLHKGTSVEWQTELLDIKQLDNKVRAILKKSDHTIENLECCWIIACDGAHSTTRKLMGVPFLGSAYKQNWWLADVQIDWALREDYMLVYVSEHGPLACFPMGDKRYRIVATAPKYNYSEPNLDDITAMFTQRCSDPARLSHPVWINKFLIHHRQIKNYRAERIFFAGDAAHVHSPIGGQGLNTGIQDIYNLIWKLALVQKGHAREALLESYHLERFPVGKDVLKETHLMTKMILLENTVAIKLRNTMASWLLSLEFVKNKLARQLAELEISYKKSPIVKALGKRKKYFKAGAISANYHFYAKERAKTHALYEILQGTMHHLFLFSGMGYVDIGLLAEVANTVKEQYPQIIVPHLVLGEKQPEPSCCAYIWRDEQSINQFITEPTAVLFRPDKYIALTQTPIDLEALLHYLSKWFVAATNK